MTSLQLLAAAAAVLGTGGIVGFIVSVFKIGPDRDIAIITAAQGAVVVQSNVIDALRSELVDLRQRVITLEGYRTEVTKLRAKVEGLTVELNVARTERDTFRRERDSLKIRVSHLERSVTRLEGEST